MEDLNDKVNNGGASAAGKLAATEWNQPASEIQNTIVAAGITLSSADLTQLLVAVSKFAGGMSNWCNDSGSSTAYVLAPLYTVAMPLFTGLTLNFRPANNNAGAAPTVNYNGTGVKTIKNESGGDVVAGDLSTLRDATIRYDGTFFRLMTNSTNLVLNNLYKKGYINGFNMIYDSANTMLIAAGEAANHTANYNLVSSSLTKDVGSNWTLGNNGGGKPSIVTLANNTFYRVYVIGGATAVTDFGIDTSSAATNILNYASTITGQTYDKQRQIGWVRTDGSAQLVPWYQPSTDLTANYWMTPYLNVDSSNPGTTQQLATIDAPILTNAILNIWVGDNSGATPAYYMDVRATAMDDIAASSSNHVIRMTDIGSGSASNNIIVEVESDGARQIAYRFGGTGMGSSVKYSISTRGFRYYRGAQ